MGCEEEASERLRGKTESEASGGQVQIKVEAWAWKEEDKKKGGQLWRRLTPGLPLGPKAREDRTAPWEELGLRAPQALPKLAGLAEGQEVRVKAQQREGEELQIL